MRKDQLPSKICPVCERPFNWRKKWSRDWDQVIYCSNACRSGKYPKHKQKELIE